MPRYGLRIVSPRGLRFGERHLMTQENYYSWRALCRKCGTPLRNGAGLFCSNFLLSRGIFPPCMNAWCGDCFTAFPSDPFPVQGLPEEEDGIESDPVEENAHQKGRKGDHVMGVPFECELCHFRNLRRRDPTPRNRKDEYLLMVMRRANLDACWGRATRTVIANWNRGVRDYVDTRSMTGLDGHEFLPRLGWPIVEDRVVGMGVAVNTLIASLRPGKHANHLQWDSMRKSTTWWNNAHNAGEGYSNKTVFARDERRVVASTSPTAGEWYTRFMRGAKSRMGQIV